MIYIGSLLAFVESLIFSLDRKVKITKVKSYNWTIIVKITLGIGFWILTSRTYSVLLNFLEIPEAKYYQEHPDIGFY